MVAGGELLTELVRAHFGDEGDKFDRILNQVIAAEARAGHTQVARRLRELRDAPTEQPKPRAVPVVRSSRSLEEFLQTEHPSVNLSDLIVPDSIRSALVRLVVEQRQHEKLASHGLHPRRKLLLHGPPGTGKTLSARAIAGELGIPMVRVRLEILFSRYLGETAGSLAEIFNEARKRRAVFLFDEFDALGSQRGAVNDVGEMRRIVGTFLQLLDADDSTSIFVAATNIAGQVDPALFRRFDDVLEYSGPTDSDRRTMIRRLLRDSRPTPGEVARLSRTSEALSLAGLAAALTDARKGAVLRGESFPTVEQVENEIVERASRAYGSSG